MMTNYYKILGVENFASTSEIKTAYRKLSKKFHPDVNQGDKFFEERFKEIQTAYEFLNTQAKRQKLDEYLRQKESNKTYQKQETESKGSQKNEQTKSNSNPAYSKTTYTKNHKDNTNQKKQTSSTAGSNNFAFILLAIGGLVIFMISQFSSNKKGEESRFENQSSKSNQTYNYPTEQFDDYKPSTSQIETESYQKENGNLARAYGNFTIGSSKQEVLSIQGNPTRTTKIDALNEEIWDYGLSSVTFRNGKVNEYSDLGNNLYVQYLESSTNTGNYSAKFSIGSSKQEVLSVQGNPTRTTKIDALNEEIWDYGLSSVTFKNGKVNEYSDLGNNLKVQY